MSKSCRETVEVTFALLAVVALVFGTKAKATPFTMTVLGTEIVLPDDRPDAGGSVIVLVGVNGNLCHLFADPTGAFIGFQNRGAPKAIWGNPFTIKSLISPDCGLSSFSNYFGGGLARDHIHFSACDGEAPPRGFDENDIFSVLNGFNVGSWSDLSTEITKGNRARSFGFKTGIGNNTSNTGWFSSTNPALLSNILTIGPPVTQVYADDLNDNYCDFTRGPSLTNPDILTVSLGYKLESSAPTTSSAEPGETFEFTNEIANIGSFPICDVSVFDDRI